MIVTSLSVLAASVRSTLARGRNALSPAAASVPRVRQPAQPVDSVELSVRAVAAVEALDGDGESSADESAQKAVERLKRASLRFHHRRIARGQPMEPTSARSQPAAGTASTPLAAAVIRKYTGR